MKRKLAVYSLRFNNPMETGHPYHKSGTSTTRTETIRRNQIGNYITRSPLSIATKQFINNGRSTSYLHEETSSSYACTRHTRGGNETTDKCIIETLVTVTPQKFISTATESTTTSPTPCNYQIPYRYR